MSPLLLDYITRHSLLHEGQVMARKVLANSTPFRERIGNQSAIDAPLVLPRFNLFLAYPYCIVID